jgi:preprotein translocase subunit Sec61beta
MGIGQHKADEAPEIHPDTVVCYALALGLVIVVELGGILAVLLERLK